ncbi:hypothetical protein P152DRAFT_7168 [Eremomyces bilateralis CBS 781.70]|uniref:CFEM domain-containing protein n=1 Tax=Eremomyces bilateralis CBS 781.70 TaxID=1392243 RepID=A0A6G1GG33_9PEZI|nr:uncharacterized protein P152DRAFT_7168 [Eremomyces bilateralis CBS 781.70]KAF1817065.1 hypothetical protein P152DRAFT_7168 [Eremomyces bilateralis CBS 781.70]
MKTVVAVAVLASIVYAQAPEVPDCAASCIGTALSANSACAEDFACHCRSQDAILESLEPCIQLECSVPEQSLVQTALEDLCSSLGVPLTVGSTGSTGSTDASHEGMDHGELGGATGSVTFDPASGPAAAAPPAAANPAPASAAPAAAAPSSPAPASPEPEHAGHGGAPKPNPEPEHPAGHGEAPKPNPEHPAGHEGPPKPNPEHPAGHGGPPKPTPSGSKPPTSSSAAPSSPSSGVGGNKTSKPTASPPVPTGQKPPAFTGEAVKNAVGGVAAFAAAVLAFAAL